MTVEADKAIWFKCESCGHGQYAQYLLEYGWMEDRAVMRGSFLCDWCNHDNEVYQEL